MSKETIRPLKPHHPQAFARILGLSALLLVLTGCQIVEKFGGSQSIKAVEPVPDSVMNNICKDPRPKICTMRYEPVCAVMVTGRVTTYPSACNACADIAVSGWRPEPCEE